MSGGLVDILDETVSGIGGSEEGKVIEEVCGGVRVLDHVASYGRVDKGEDGKDSGDDGKHFLTKFA